WRGKEDPSIFEILDPAIVIDEQSLIAVPSRNARNLILINAGIFDISIFEALLGRIFDPAPAALKARKVEVEQGGVRNAKRVQQPPEMIDVPAAQWDDGDRRVISKNPTGSQQPREHHLLAIAFAKNYESGEIQFRKGLHAFADIF